jgi:FKBP-type peptidyl-prolyl cis-trans isomerase
MKFRICAVVVAALLAGLLIAGQAAKPAKAGKMVTLPDGLKYQDVVVGKGASPKPGQTVIVDYVGTFQNGTKFDASADHGGTFSFNIGEHQVIPGWDEGVMTMKIGGTRKLIIPPDLGYGPNGQPPTIPPNATLLFTIKLIDAE